MQISDMKQTQPNLQNKVQILKILFIIPSEANDSEWRLFCLSTRQSKATLVPTPNQAPTKRAKWINSRRYAADRRSGVADQTEDVSTTDDEFPQRCPRMITGGDILSNSPGKGKVRAVIVGS
jgi:hypothetical protein